MNINKNGWFALLAMMALIGILVTPFTASAEVMYGSYTKDSYDEVIWVQPPTYPIDIIGDRLFEENPDNPTEQQFSPLNNPRDVFIDDNDHIYVVDTGNDRIVHFDKSGELIRFITVADNPLSKPEGLYVTDSGEIYVADTGNKRVVHLNPEGEFIREFLKPESRFIPESFKYDPIKLVVDKRGYIYIATLGGYQGLLQLDPEGNFQSFYGANRTQFSILDAFKRAVYTREMYSREIAKLPGSISNVTVDEDGFIYTVTAGNEVTREQIKKLNINGDNMLDRQAKKQTAKKSYGETLPWDAPVTPLLTEPQLIDIAVDADGNMTAIDSNYKYINQYDSVGNLLFFWGGPFQSNTTQLGRVKNPIAIDINSDNDMFILDAQDNVLHVFRQSEFGTAVYAANRLTTEGRYEESEGPWSEVLRLNAQYTPAILGLAKAAFKKGEYERARELFYEAGDQKGYSDAFWQIRLLWFQKHFSWLASTILIGAVVLLVLEKATRNTSVRIRWRNRQRSKHPLIMQLKHAFYILKHPIDGFTAIRYEQKGSYPSAFILLALVCVSLVISRVYTSFSFNKVVVDHINAVTIISQFFLVWIVTT